jgi:cobalt-zinc-cadmium efflux system membrane fusion protein
MAAFRLTGAACAIGSIVFSGCSAHASAAQNDRDLRPVASEGVVQIAEASRQFIVVEPAWGDSPSGTLRAPAAHGTLGGRVSSIGSVVASGLRTAPIRITLSSDSGPLRPGMYGQADIATPPATGSLTLPAEAILVKGKDTVVYVEKDRTTFVRQSLVVGQSVDGRVHVISGLAPGDRVVTHGALLLDGAADQLM